MLRVLLRVSTFGSIQKGRSVAVGMSGFETLAKGGKPKRVVSLHSVKTLLAPSTGTRPSACSCHWL